MGERGAPELQKMFENRGRFMVLCGWVGGAEMQHRVFDDSGPPAPRPHHRQANEMYGKNIDLDPNWLEKIVGVLVASWSREVVQEVVRGNSSIGNSLSKP